MLKKFLTEFFADAIYLWGTLIIGILVGVAVAAVLFYVFKLPESNALGFALIPMTVIFVLAIFGRKRAGNRRSAF